MNKVQASIIADQRSNIAKARSSLAQIREEDVKQVKTMQIAERSNAHDISIEKI